MDAGPSQRSPSWLHNRRGVTEPTYCPNMAIEGEEEDNAVTARAGLKTQRKKENYNVQQSQWRTETFAFNLWRSSRPVSGQWLVGVQYTL